MPWQRTSAGGTLHPLAATPSSPLDPSNPSELPFEINLEAEGIAPAPPTATATSPLLNLNWYANLSRFILFPR
jgi:hypothetical protein